MANNLNIDSELDDAEYAAFEQWLTGLAAALQESAYLSSDGMRIRKCKPMVEFFRASTAAPLATAPREAGELAKLREDAARYRWLRHGDNDELVIQHGPVAPDYHWLPRNARLDEMIDTHIARAALPHSMGKGEGNA